LAVIFWDFGRKVEEEQEENEPEVEVQDFDDDAEMQARIWNRFQKMERA
jgi:hypothetical protein